MYNIQIKNKIKFFLLLCGLLVLTQCSEETFEVQSTGTLTGMVVSDGDNTPLANVRISTNPASSTVFTDENGMFTIEEIVVDQYSVQAELEGFSDAFEAANITGGMTVNVVFELETETANNEAVSTPVIQSPPDNATAIPLETQLVWSGSDPEGDDINYRIALRNDFDNEVLEFTTVNDTLIDVQGLRFGLRYFWQVTASDVVNGEEVSSQISSFETVDVTSSFVDNRVIFVRQIAGNGVLFSTDGEGREFQLSDAAINSFRPRRNNAANRIAFLSNDGAETHIFTMALDGTDIRQLTSAVPINGFDLNEIDFTWTNSGGRILYSNFDRLFSINSDGTGLQQIFQTTDGSFISEVAISADESIIALKTNNAEGYNVSVFTIDGNGTEVDSILSGVTGAAGGLDISVDNQQILYWYDVSGFESIAYRQLDARTFIFNRNDGSTIDISDQKEDGTNDFDCRFVPNEAQVILTNTSNDGISRNDILIIDTNPDAMDMGMRNVIVEDGSMPDFQ